ncbi:Sec-independent protein translocase protein TatC [Dactylosporangium sucinum]|uniref:Sec-independent protein translocase protein TatC n=2 Tax=Dactylosporangium sucinum TaxID=1424081 RepID=A0A917WR06_9ACTN|nr:Sec-independent protein translocase protein TatC [Dactylosporangium sucinum]
MSILPGRRRTKAPSQFQRAADGSMTLMEHLRELRNRLFKACLGIVVGFGIGYWLSGRAIALVKDPVCKVLVPRTGDCNFVQLGVADFFLLQLKVGLWLGLLFTAPWWMYQLWAFVAPGLHRKERKYAYIFVSIAAPLFALGAYLAWFALGHGLQFLLPPAEVVTTSLDITRYVDFITTGMLVFGVAFEFPLIAMMLNFAGVLSGRKLLGWWRFVVFIFFAFAAVATPTPDPFTMTGLALAMSLLYFGAVAVALINDRRKGRNRPAYADIGDDETSSLDDYDVEPVGAATSVGGYDPIEPVTPVDAPTPVERSRSLDRRYDDVT